MSNIGGYQSNFINFGFDELLSFVLNDAKNIPLLKDKKFKLAGFWLNVNKGHHYNSIHVHAIQTLSVVYYHKICCDKTPIVFTSHVPYISQHMVKFTPEEQDIIYFDGMQPHFVESCNQEEHTRISIAFNLDLY